MTLPEFGVGWTTAGMVGVEESDNAIVKILYVLLVTSNRAARPQVNSRGYCRGEGHCPLKDSKKKNYHPKFSSAIIVSSLARQLRSSAMFALKCR